MISHGGFMARTPSATDRWGESAPSRRTAYNPHIPPPRGHTGPRTQRWTGRWAHQQAYPSAYRATAPPRHPVLEHLWGSREWWVLPILPLGARSPRVPPRRSSLKRRILRSEAAVSNSNPPAYVTDRTPKRPDRRDAPNLRQTQLPPHSCSARSCPVLVRTGSQVFDHPGGDPRGEPRCGLWRFPTQIPG